MLLWLFAFVGVMTTSCIPPADGGGELATLTLSQEEVTFPKEVAKESVAIQTNQETWNYFVGSDKDWLKLEKSGTSLEIEVTANNLGTPRKAEVLILAGGASQKLTILQSAADVVVATDPAEVTLSARGGEKLLEVVANVKQWELTLGEGGDWLQVEPKANRSMLLLTAEPNETAEERVAQIFLKGEGGKQTQVNVRQVGLEKFIFPCLDFTVKDEFDLINFERARGSHLFYRFHHEWAKQELKFYTSSLYMPMIFYSFYPTGGPFIFAEFTSPYLEPFTGKDCEYVQFLKEHGFSEIEGTELPTYKNNKMGVKVDIQLIQRTDKLRASAVVTFREFFEQDGPMPTFDALPMDEIKYLNKPEVKSAESAEIAKMEAEAGSTLVADFREKGALTMQNYKMSSDKGKLANRIWYYYFEGEEDGTKYPALLGSVSQYWLAYSDTELGFYEHRGAYYLTNEFKALAEASGWLYIGVENKTHGFVDPVNGLLIMTEVSSRPKVNDEKPAMLLVFMHADLGGGSSFSRAKEQLTLFANSVR